MKTYRPKISVFVFLLFIFFFLGSRAYGERNKTSILKSGNTTAISILSDDKQEKLLQRLKQLLGGEKETSDEDIKKEIGADRLTALTPEQRPNVELTLKSSVEQPIAGELWTIFATITNHSTFPVWIVDRATSLVFVPELGGRSNKTGSIGAFFPTIRSRHTDEVIRIEPSSTYIFTFKIDPVNFSENTEQNSENNIPWKIIDMLQPMLGENGVRIANSITQFSFFVPATYELSSVVHIWVKPPEIDTGTVKNFGDTVTIISSIKKPVESPPWVLIMGASIGGILCFMLRKFYQSEGEQSEVQPQTVITENTPTTATDLPPNPILQKLTNYPITHYLIVRECFKS